MKTKPFEEHTKKYEDWFERNRFAYKSELQAVKQMLPKKGKCVEIGVGSGRFAAPLGIKYGLEPSPKMRAIAKKKGIEVIDGVAEKLPYNDESFDYALMVTTLCFLDDVDRAFSEVHRVLRPEGYFINGFVDKESKIGKSYENHKQENVFYNTATFYSVDEVVKHLEKTGFNNFNFNQTIFHSLGDIKSVEPVKEGYGEGSFVVVRARK
jgi:ubiquinone/menaquinone biosynthesis C-methylase UbiE